MPNGSEVPGTGGGSAPVTHSNPVGRHHAIASRRAVAPAERSRNCHRDRDVTLPASTGGMTILWRSVLDESNPEPWAPRRVTPGPPPRHSSRECRLLLQRATDAVNLPVVNRDGVEDEDAADRGVCAVVAQVALQRIVAGLVVGPARSAHPASSRCTRRPAWGRTTFFPPRLQRVVGLPHRLAPHVRLDAPPLRFLGGQANRPPRTPLGRWSADHGHNRRLLTV